MLLCLNLFLISEGDAIFANFKLPGDNKNFSGYIKQLCLKEDGNLFSYID